MVDVIQSDWDFAKLVFGHGPEWRPTGFDLGRLRDLAKQTARHRIASAPKWLPIESAPRDGTPVIIFCENEDEYITDIGTWNKSKFVGMLLSHSDSPTHWQPLPTPPEDTHELS